MAAGSAHPAAVSPVRRNANRGLGRTAGPAASTVTVTVETDDVLRLTVHDDGVGGADSSRGTGLLGLKDRVEALGGRIHLDSPPGAGTSLHAYIPLT